MVFGYVDGLGEIVFCYEDVCFICLQVKVSDDLVKYIVYKGFICVDGISLIVNVVSGVLFDLNIVFYIVQEIMVG